MDPDRVRVERSGGFGGLTLRASLDRRELSGDEEAALEECFSLPPADPSGPDRFVYRFRLGDREAEVQEDRLPSRLVPLVRRLSHHWTPALG